MAEQDLEGRANREAAAIIAQRTTNDFHDLVAIAWLRGYGAGHSDATEYARAVIEGKAS